METTYQIAETSPTASSPFEVPNDQAETQNGKVQLSRLVCTSVVMSCLSSLLLGFDIGVMSGAIIAIKEVHPCFSFNLSYCCFDSSIH